MLLRRARGLAFLKREGQTCRRCFSESTALGQYDDIVSTVPPLKDNVDQKNIALQAMGGRSSVSGIRATVFGGSSILGHAVINMMGQIGSQVVVPYRGDGREVRRVKMMGDLGQIIPLPFHIRDERTVRRAIEGSNIVINLLGNRRESWNFTYHDVHVNGSHLLAKTAMECGADRFIQVSSLTAAPDAISEFDRTKWHGEQVVKQYYPEATILRPSLTYGCNDRFMYWMAQTWKHWWFKTPYVLGPNRVVNPVAVEDVALAVMRAVTSPIETAGKTYHLTGELEATQEMFMDRIGKVLSMKEVGARLQRHEPDFWLPLLAILRPIQKNFVPPILWQLVPRMYFTYDEVMRQKTDQRKPEFDEHGNPALTHDDLGIKPRDYFDREAILMEPFHPMDYWIYDGCDWVR